jgi:TPR repeat protein
LSEGSKELTPQVSLQESSLQQLTSLASQGDTLAQFALGLRYATGSDAPQDYTEAVRWFSSAADRGQVLSQSTLAAYYLAGRGVPQDFRKGYFWALVAQSAGDDASRARIPLLVSRLNRNDLVEIQHQAEEWLKLHRVQSKPAAAHK